MKNRVHAVTKARSKDGKVVTTSECKKHKDNELITKNVAIVDCEECLKLLFYRTY